MIKSAKNYTKNTPQKRTDKTLGQMVKPKLYRQNHRKYTHTHSQKEKKGKKIKYIYIYIYKKEESNQINN